jgi:hypothetical protein
MCKEMTHISKSLHLYWFLVQVSRFSLPTSTADWGRVSNQLVLNLQVGEGCKWKAAKKTEAEQAFPHLGTT